MMPEAIEMRVIGTVVSPVTEERDDGWGSVVSEVRLEESFAKGLRGLDSFSHAIVIFWMHRASFDATRDLERHPRERTELPLAGILAQRAKHRPNPIGITAVAIERVDGRSLFVRGLDAIDGTPVLDLKPYVPVFDRVEGATVPDWMNVIMKDYFA